MVELQESHKKIIKVIDTTLMVLYELELHLMILVRG